ncbi:MAG: branched-chain amino acid ABC transporter permease [Actinobacteria bacterium]|nr:branched-chain amino acid ABC transporter permease [Actinomycetota bacterium]
MGQNSCVSFERRTVLRDSLSVAIPVGSYGAAFGAAAVAGGFSVLQACALSLLLFSGASQFAVVGVMAGGGTPLSAIATGALLGIRNGLYGMRMAPILKLSGIRRFLGAQITIDESTGVALSQESRGEDAMRYGFFATGIGVFIFWNLFTFIGALGANSIGDPSSWGLDAAVPAAFLGLVWPRLVNNKTRIAALLSVLLALSLTPFLGAGLPIIATVLIALVIGWKS